MNSVVAHFLLKLVVDAVNDRVEPIIVIIEIVIGKSTTDMVVVVAVLLFFGVIVVVFDIVILIERQRKHPQTFVEYFVISLLD